MAHTADLNSDLGSLPTEQLVLHLREASQQDASIYCEEIIRRFEPLLRKAWRGATINVDYQDYLQEVLLKLFGSLVHLKNPKAFPGYFRRVVLSVIVDYSRRQRSGIHVLTLDEVDEVVDRVDEQILTEIFVRSYIEHLSPREREVIILGSIQEEPVNEIAKKLKISPGAVRATKARAIKRLRGLLLDEAGALENSPHK